MTNTDADLARAMRALDVALIPASAVLTDDTSAEAIEARHRELVRELLERWPDATEEEISDALDLPRWNVRRATHFLRGEPEPAKVARSKRKNMRDNCGMFSQVKARRKRG